MHSADHSALLWARRCCIKASLRKLIDTGVGICLARNLSACGREASKLSLLDKILREYPSDIRKLTAEMLIQIDIQTMRQKQMSFLSEHTSINEEDVFFSQGSCGRRGFRCQPCDESAYLELEYHYNALLKTFVRDMRRLNLAMAWWSARWWEVRRCAL